MVGEDVYSLEPEEEDVDFLSFCEQDKQRVSTKGVNVQNVVSSLLVSANTYGRCCYATPSDIVYISTKAFVHRNSPAGDAVKLDTHDRAPLALAISADDRILAAILSVDEGVCGGKLVFYDLIVSSPPQSHPVSTTFTTLSKGACLCCSWNPANPSIIAAVFGAPLSGNASSNPLNKMGGRVGIISLPPTGSTSTLKPHVLTGAPASISYISWDNTGTLLACGDTSGKVTVIKCRINADSVAIDNILTVLNTPSNLFTSCSVCHINWIEVTTKSESSCAIIACPIITYRIAGELEPVSSLWWRLYPDGTPGPKSYIMCSHTLSYQHEPTPVPTPPIHACSLSEWGLVILAAGNTPDIHCFSITGQTWTQLLPEDSKCITLPLGVNDESVYPVGMAIGLTCSYAPREDTDPGGLSPTLLVLTSSGMCCAYSIHYTASDVPNPFPQCKPPNSLPTPSPSTKPEIPNAEPLKIEPSKIAPLKSEPKFTSPIVPAQPVQNAEKQTKSGFPSPGGGAERAAEQHFLKFHSALQDIKNVEDDLKELLLKGPARSALTATLEHTSLLRNQTEQVAFQHREISEAYSKTKIALLRTMGKVEETKSLLEARDDPNYQQLLLSRPLDVDTIRRSDQLREKEQSVESLINTINEHLERLWREQVKSRSSATKKAAFQKRNATYDSTSDPHIDTLFQTLASHYEIATRQQDTIRGLEQQLKKLQLLDNSSRKHRKGIPKARSNMAFQKTSSLGSSLATWHYFPSPSNSLFQQDSEKIPSSPLSPVRSERDTFVRETLQYHLHSPGRRRFVKSSESCLQQENIMSGDEVNEQDVYKPIIQKEKLKSGTAEDTEITVAERKCFFYYHYFSYHFTFLDHKVTPPNTSLSSAPYSARASAFPPVKLDMATKPKLGSTSELTPRGVKPIKNTTDLEIPPQSEAPPLIVSPKPIKLSIISEEEKSESESESSNGDSGPDDSLPTSTISQQDQNQISETTSASQSAPLFQSASIFPFSTPTKFMPTSDTVPISKPNTSDSTPFSFTSSTTSNAKPFSFSDPSSQPDALTTSFSLSKNPVSFPSSNEKEAEGLSGVIKTQGKPEKTFTPSTKNVGKISPNGPSFSFGNIATQGNTLPNTSENVGKVSPNSPPPVFGGTSGLFDSKFGTTPTPSTSFGASPTKNTGSPSSPLATGTSPPRTAAPVFGATSTPLPPQNYPQYKALSTASLGTTLTASGTSPNKTITTSMPSSSSPKSSSTPGLTHKGSSLATSEISPPIIAAPVFGTIPPHSSSVHSSPKTPPVFGISMPSSSPPPKTLSTATLPNPISSFTASPTSPPHKNLPPAFGTTSSSLGTSPSSVSKSSGFAFTTNEQQPKSPTNINSSDGDKKSLPGTTIFPPVSSPSGFAFMKNEQQLQSSTIESTSTVSSTEKKEPLETKTAPTNSPPILTSAHTPASQAPSVTSKNSEPATSNYQENKTNSEKSPPISSSSTKETLLTRPHAFGTSTPIQTRVTTGSSLSASGNSLAVPIFGTTTSSLGNSPPKTSTTGGLGTTGSSMTASGTSPPRTAPSVFGNSPPKASTTGGLSSMVASGTSPPRTASVFGTTSSLGTSPPRTVVFGQTPQVFGANTTASPSSGSSTTGSVFGNTSSPSVVSGTSGAPSVFGTAQGFGAFGSPGIGNSSSSSPWSSSESSSMIGDGNIFGLGSSAPTNPTKNPFGGAGNYVFGQQSSGGGGLLQPSAFGSAADSLAKSAQNTTAPTVSATPFGSAGPSSSSVFNSCSSNPPPFGTTATLAGVLATSTFGGNSGGPSSFGIATPGFGAYANPTAGGFAGVASGSQQPSKSVFGNDTNSTWQRRK